ncbi:hypothetical protein SAMN03159284_01808 [Mucilaginibacter sp. NFR10]|nr:hypothetical protein SAMN03159284_01808 [Mucilaginibacter sp. NFR10]
MKFDDLDEKMRIYETSQDRCVLPDMYIVAMDEVSPDLQKKHTNSKHLLTKNFGT